MILPSLPAPPAGLPEVIINSSNVGVDGTARTNYVALMASTNSNPANLAFKGEVESKFQNPSNIQLFAATNAGDPNAPLTCTSPVVFLRQYFYDDQSAGLSSLTWSLDGGTSFVTIPSQNRSNTDPSCVNDPVAGDDQQIISGLPSPGSPITVAVLQNDTNPDNNIDPVTVALVSTAAIDTDMDGDADSLTVPGEGTWTVDGTLGTITFTPVAGFTGDPSPIEYVLSDLTGLISNIARVQIQYLGITAGAMAVPTLGVSGLLLLFLMLIAVTSLRRRPGQINRQN